MNCSIKIMATYTRLILCNARYCWHFRLEDLITICWALVCTMLVLLSSGLQLIILFKTFVLFFWSCRIKYRLIVCTLLMRFNGFKLVYWYLYTFLFSYFNTAFFILLSSLLHFYTAGTLFHARAVPIYNNRRLYVVDQLQVHINSNYLKIS